MELKHDKVGSIANPNTINRFARTAVLLGALALGCTQNEQGQTLRSPLPAPPVAMQEAPRPQAKGVAVNCRGVGTTLQEGQEIWFGTGSNSPYGMKATRIKGDTVFTDLTVPYASPIQAVDVISYTLRFDSLELPRSKFGLVAEGMCQRSGEVIKMMEAVGQAIERTVENTQKLMQVFQNVQGSRHAAKKESGNAETRPQSVQAGPANSADGLRDSMPDYSGAMAQNIRSERILNMALSQVLALMEGTPVTYDGKGTPFRVEGSDSEAFLLVAEGGGRRFRLDRRLDLNVEFLFEKAGFFTSPYKIDALTVDAAGIVHADVSLDCSRPIRMEIFMSEHASGPHPACGKR